MTRPSQEVAQRQAHPAVVVRDHHGARLAGMVPTHVNGDSWVRLAVATLRDPDLCQAATANLDSFMVAVERAAQLGLRPGTEEFYLIPRGVKGRGKPMVQGIVGYQGLVDLMYRSGAVQSVVAETVHDQDVFRYVPGRDERPVHEIDWFGGVRGKLVGVYAYAIMAGGATSRVVVLGQTDIDRIKASSDGASSEYSPWRKHEESMWLKSAVRQLAKWVPTSTEYIAQRARAERVGAESPVPVAPVLDDPVPAIEAPPAGVDPASGEVLVDWPPEGADQ